MKTISISGDTVDGLFRDILSSDYLKLIDQIQAMEAKIAASEEIKPYELEDLSNWTKTALAINVLFDWYLLPEEAEKIRSQS